MTVIDPLFARQWHFKLLGDINTIWNEFSGAGIAVGVYDDGIQYDHPDLDGNYESGLHFTLDGDLYDAYPINLTAGDVADGHGTSVAGLIAAEANNGIGGVGVAWGAKVTGVNILEDPRFGGESAEDEAREIAAFRHAANFDIMSNSWGYDALGFFDFLNRGDDGSFGAAVEDAFGHAAREGRGGLGTVIVKSAGNDAANANGDGLNGSRFVIDVAALGSSGQIQSYSNYGTNILVSAGAASVTTDLAGSNGFNTASGAAGNYVSDFGGTSAAAPVVTGVVALMLDANEDLGWRDVREILATSASLTGSVVTGNQDYEISGTYFRPNGRWDASTATYLPDWDSWNDGGRAYSLDYGYGRVDAYAAVRMAEAWSLFRDAPQTSDNEVALTTGIETTQVLLISNATYASQSIDLVVGEDLRVEHADLTLTFNMTPYTTTRELHLTVLAPDGVYFPVIIGEDDLTPAENGDPFSWTFGIAQAIGINAQGTWRIRFEMPTITAAEIELNVTEMSLDIYGSAWDDDNVHHITRDFVLANSKDPGAGRDRVLTDINGGDDWINMSSIAGAVTATLDGAGRILVAGVQWATIAADALIENLVTGDGADRLTGSALDNVIHGMRGNDSVTGLAGDDTLVGGAGNDSLNGGIGNDDIEGGTGIDSLFGSDGDDALSGGDGNDTLSGGNGADDLDGGAGLDTLDGGAGADALSGSEGNDLFLIGAFGDHGPGESVSGGAGVDELRFTGLAAGTLVLAAEVDVERVVIGTGTAAIAVLKGKAAIGVDASAVQQGLFLLGNGGANRLTGTAFGDTMDGGRGNDTLAGGAGDDTLTGGRGVDVFVFGTAGNVDRITDFNASSDTIWLDRSIFTGLAAGTLGRTGFAANLTGLAEDAFDRVIYAVNTGFVYFDADGAGGADRVQFATLNSGPSLTSADFFVF